MLGLPSQVAFASCENFVLPLFVKRPAFSTESCSCTSSDHRTCVHGVGTFLYMNNSDQVHKPDRIGLNISMMLPWARTCVHRGVSRAFGASDPYAGCISLALADDVSGGQWFAQYLRISDHPSQPHVLQTRAASYMWVDALLHSLPVYFCSA